jgi:hypothetical protein
MPRHLINHPSSSSAPPTGKPGRSPTHDPLQRLPGFCVPGPSFPSPASCLHQTSSPNRAGWARHVASPLPHTAKRLASSSHRAATFSLLPPPAIKSDHRHLGRVGVCVVGEDSPFWEACPGCHDSVLAHGIWRRLWTRSTLQVGWLRQTNREYKKNQGISPDSFAAGLSEEV